MGVVTASVGGIMRDVVAMRPSVLLDRELYATAAVVGSVVTILLVETGFGGAAAGSAGALAAFVTRAGAILFGWQQPLQRGWRNPDA